jgi:hypothetical protein
MQHSTYDVTRWRSHPYILERACPQATFKETEKKWAVLIR